MKEQISPDVVAAILEQAQNPMPPPEWKIHVIPRHPTLVSLLPGGRSPMGCLLSFLLLNGLLLLLEQFFGNANPPLASDGAAIALWAISVLIVVSIISRLIRERSRQGLVVITTEQVLVFDPVRFFRRVRVLPFADVQGMVLKRADSTHPDTGTVITFYGLEWRDALGKQRIWSLNERYEYVSRHVHALRIYEEIIAQFERYHLNQTEGLQAYRQVTDWPAL